MVNFLSELEQMSFQYGYVVGFIVAFLLIIIAYVFDRF